MIRKPSPYVVGKYSRVRDNNSNCDTVHAICVYVCTYILHMCMHKRAEVQPVCECTFH